MLELSTAFVLSRAPRCFHQGGKHVTARHSCEQVSHTPTIECFASLHSYLATSALPGLQQNARLRGTHDSQRWNLETPKPVLVVRRRSIRKLRATRVRLGGLHSILCTLSGDEESQLKRARSEWRTLHNAIPILIVSIATVGDEKEEPVRWPSRFERCNGHKFRDHRLEHRHSRFHYSKTTSKVPPDTRLCWE